MQMHSALPNDSYIVILRYSEESDLGREGLFASERALVHRLDPSEYLRMTLMGAS